ncbi:hypothetical protein [Actinomadura nitritigenes]|uniref:hypothetical protein n=1 Tax=Actinomadura nitritigenes TaxID=134602 RepID=UPI003D89D1B5
MSGLNYSHVYWNFPFQPGRYSYVRRANRAGYATLAEAERPFYPRARVDAIVVPHAGHAINLHRNADLAYRGILTWTDRVLAGRAPSE